MRCKNCGCENDDNLYICQNCGSPLYDEDEGPITNGGSSEQQNNTANQTQVFDINSANQTGNEYQNYAQNAQNQGAYTANTSQNTKMQTSNGDDEQEKKKKQQTIIIIAVLSVILVAVIAGTIFAVAHKNSSDAPSNISSSSSTSQTDSTSSTRAYSSTTRFTTQSTTASTTASTQTTKETTTAAPVTYAVSVSVDGEGGGSVSGGGSYKSGKRVTVIASPDEGYEFKGWYSGDSLMSTSSAYSFHASQNIDLTAKFAPSQTSDNVPNADGGED